MFDAPAPRPEPRPVAAARPLRRTLRIGRDRVSIWRAGTGTPVLLLHGNGSSGLEIVSAFPALPGVAWIAPDRPGHGESTALHRADPAAQAAWLARLIARLELPPVSLVAHSLAAGSAIALAHRWPERVARLVLLAPFCRPTPEQAMPALRLGGIPGAGRALRLLLVPPLVAAFRDRLARAMFAPDPVPPRFDRLPLSRIGTPRSVGAMGAELRQFNATMRDLAPRLMLPMPVVAVHGSRDPTADPAWHLPWLAARCRALGVVRVPGRGHMNHHTAPQATLAAVLDHPIPQAGDPMMSALPEPPRRPPSAAPWIALGALGVVAGVGAAWLLRSEEEARMADSAPEHARRGAKVAGRTVTIDAPASRIYATFRDPAQIPRLLDGVAHVEPAGDGTFTWHLTPPVGDTVQVATRYTVEREGEELVWESTLGDALAAGGHIRLHDAGEHGTEVEMTLDWHPPSGLIGLAAQAVAGLGAETRARYALKRLKMLIETGEIATAARRPDDKE